MLIPLTPKHLGADLTHAARESIYAVAFSTRTVDRCVYFDDPRRGVV